MDRYDHLLALAGYHRALRWANLKTPEAVLAANLVTRATLRHCYGEVRRLVLARHPNVMAALWPPDPEVSWEVAILTTESGVRLLSVNRGWVGGRHETLLSMRYSVDDPEGEREAWLALVAVLATRPRPDRPAGADGRDPPR